MYVRCTCVCKRIHIWISGLMGQQRTTDESNAPQQKIDSPNHGQKLTLNKHLKIVPAIDKKPVTMNAVDPNKYRTISLCVLFLLCFLFIVNIFLLFKLWTLEYQLKEANNSPLRADTKYALIAVPLSSDINSLSTNQAILYQII